MQESDYPDSEYFWLPIPKALAYRYWLQFPDKNDEDFIRDLPEIALGALKAIERMRQREVKASPQPARQDQHRFATEEPYLSCQLNEDVQELYR